jgi:hypothetical protein
MCWRVGVLACWSVWRVGVKNKKIIIVMSHHSAGSLVDLAHWTSFQKWLLGPRRPARRGRAASQQTWMKASQPLIQPTITLRIQM